MMFRGSVRSIYFVGIGGIGMSGIAEVLVTLGYTVMGSDLKESSAVKRLRGLGVKVFIGHDGENIGDADVVIRSTAVGMSNPEVKEAIHRGVPVIRRAEMLAELMRLKYGVAVAGSHGKTTTTSMLAATLEGGGLDPTVVIGGRLDSLGGTNARLGAGDYLVAEADESDGTFLFLSPTVAIVTNIDPEHLDHYGTFENLEKTFLEFVNRVPFYGFGVLCIDHPVVQRLLSGVRRRAVTYGFARHADYRAVGMVSEGLVTTFQVYHQEDHLGEVTIDMPGEHNVSNALATIATSLELSVPFETIKRSLHKFTGVQRRFTVRGEPGDVVIVDDYAHHPVEIDATLSAAAAGYGDRKIVAIFQPHRYSRVRDLWEDFCGAFNGADQVVVCPVYAAGEPPIEGINAEQIAEGLRCSGHRAAVAVSDLESAADYACKIAKAGDLVITLGAGDVNKVCDQLLEHFSTVGN